MTDRQWRVILALVRVVLTSQGYAGRLTFQTKSGQDADIDLLIEASLREET